MGDQILLDARAAKEASRVLATLSAVKTDGFVALDDWLYTTTSHELLVAAEILAASADDWLDATR